MSVIEDDNGAISVRYIKTHTSHSPGIAEVRHIPLPKEVREDVKTLFSQNVKLDSLVVTSWGIYISPRKCWQKGR